MIYKIGKSVLQFHGNSPSSANQTTQKCLVRWNEISRSRYCINLVNTLNILFQPYFSTYTHLISSNTRKLENRPFTWIINFWYQQLIVLCILFWVVGISNIDAFDITTVYFQREVKSIVSQPTISWIGDSEWRGRGEGPAKAAHFKQYIDLFI